jgi:hypothetical protein
MTTKLERQFEEYKQKTLTKRNENEAKLKLAHCVIPVRGMGATKSKDVSRTPYTIVDVHPTLKSIAVQIDTVSFLEGSYNPETGKEYARFKKNKDAPKIKYTLRQDGRYYEYQTSCSDWNNSIFIGQRLFYDKNQPTVHKYKK